MIEDHLGFEPVAAFGLLAELDQPLRIQQRVGVALEATRVPRQVDQEPTKDLVRVSARRLLPTYWPCQ